MIRPKVYLAGPITGKDWQKTKKRFKDVEKILEEAGYDVSNPCDHQIKGGTWGEYMRKGLKAMLDCDAVFMFRDWPDSKGASIEYNLARKLSMGVIYEDELKSIVARITEKDK